MAKSFNTVFLALLILSANAPTTSALFQELVGAAVGAAAIAVGGPLVLPFIGFTGAGITGGSIAAGMMSTAATTGYGAAVVAGLQSAGAAGVGLGSVAFGAGTGAAIGAATKGCEEKRNNCKN